jgi:predicted SnoaL-like aldol condensation-catalyzing enzyme
MLAAAERVLIQEDNVELIRNFYIEVFKNRSFDICHRLMIEDYINHSASVSDTKDAFIDYFKQFHRTFSHSDTEIGNIFCRGDLVCVYADHWASNKFFSVKFKAIDIYRIESGMIVEHWDSIEGLNNFSKFMFTIKSLLRL